MLFFKRNNSKNRNRPVPPTSYSQDSLIPTSEIIKLSKEAGVDSGPGNPSERIRYFVKLGLLPYAVRKVPTLPSEALAKEGNRPPSTVNPPIGHLPFSCVARLVEIQKLNEKGLSFPQIAAKFKKQAQSQALGHAETEAESLALSTDTPIVVKVFPIETAHIQKTLKEHEKKLASLSQAKSSKILSGVEGQAFDQALDPEAKSKLNLKNGLFLLLALTLTSAGTFGTYKHISQKNALKPNPQTAGLTTSGQVLAASSENHKFYIDADTEVTGTTLFEKDITAPNVIYSVTAGTGIAVTGGQNPTVSLDSTEVVTSINDLTGTLTLKASGSTSISKSGSEITISSTSTSESDTLSTVTGRGATTTTAVALNGGLTSSSATPITLSSTAPVLAIGNTGTLAITDGTNTLFSVVDQGAFGTIRLTDKASTGDPATCTAGDIYFNGTDTTVKACTAANTWEALDGAASAMTSFTLSGDTGTDQTISDANTLEIAGGTNGIDTVGTATDTITLNLDTTEIGTTTWGTGSSIVWTFNSGTTDPVLTFGDNALTIGTAATITATDVTAFNCTDCLNFDDISDSPTLDATTTVAFSTLDLNLNLSSTGVLNIQDGGTTFVSFDDDSTIDVTFPAAGTLGIDATTTASTINAAGVIDLNVTSATSNNRGLDISYTFNSTTASALGYGIYGSFAHTNASLTTDNHLYGAYLTETDSTALANTNFGIALYGNVTGDGAITKNVYGVYSGLVNDNTTTDQGTRNTYAGYFTAVGSTRGTATTYGVYAAAATGDTNYGLYVATGSTRISLDCSTGDQYVTAASTGVLACGTDDSTGGSFTLTGSDAGTNQTISNADTLTIAAGTGIDTTPSATDTLTVAFDSTEIGTTTWGTGSSIVWTFNSGTTDPVLTFGDNALTIATAATITATDVTAFNCTDCIDFDDIANSPTLDETTDINLSTLDLYVDLTSSGVFSIRDVATAFWTFDDDSTVDVIFPAAGTIGIDATATANTTTANGVFDVNVTSATSDNRGIDLAYTFNSTTASAVGYGLYGTYTHSNASLTTANTLYGQYQTLVDSTALANTNFGITFYGNITGDGAVTKTIYGIYSDVLSDNTTTDQGTRITYGAYISGRGSTRGTNSAYGVYATASGGDNNYGLYIAGGNTYLGTTAYGASLTDCDTAASSKLLWSDTGVFSCGTDTGSSGIAWSALTAPTTSLSLAFDAGETTTFTASETTGTFFTYTGTAFTVGEILDITGTFAPADGSTNEAIDINITHTPTVSADNFQALNLALTDATTLGNTIYGIYGSTASSGAISGVTRNLTGIYGMATGTNAANAASTVSNVYGAIFNAVGENAGASMTGNSYGIYTIASGADNNYAAYFNGKTLSTTSPPTGSALTDSSFRLNSAFTPTAAITNTANLYISTNVQSVGPAGSRIYGIYNLFTDPDNTSDHTVFGQANIVTQTGTGANAIRSAYGLYNSVTSTGSGVSTEVLAYGIASFLTGDTLGTTNTNYGLYMTTSGADNNYGIFATAASMESYFTSTAGTKALSLASNIVSGGVLNARNSSSTEGSAALVVNYVETAIVRQNSYGLYNNFIATGVDASGAGKGSYGLYNLFTSAVADTGTSLNQNRYFASFNEINYTAATAGIRHVYGLYGAATTDVLASTNLSYAVLGIASGGDNNYGGYFSANDSTTNTPTNFGVISQVIYTGNAAKVGTGVYGLITSSSTTADSIYGGYFKTRATENAARTTNYGAIAYGQSSSTTGDTLYGAYGTAVSTGVISGTTRTSVGTYGVATNSGAADAASTISNVYGGIFVATGENPGASTVGNSYGVYALASGGDTNYPFYMGNAPVSSGTAALCWDNAGESPINDCSGTPVADYAEIFPTAQDVEFKDVLVTGSKIVSYKGIDQFGNVSEDQNNTEESVELVKSSTPYDPNVIGVASNNYGDFSSVGHNRIDKADHSLPISLSGRIKVKVTDEGGPINVGDLLTTSSTPGHAMKADPKLGSTFGKALTSFSGPGAGEALVFIEVNTRYNLAQALQNTNLDALSFSTSSNNTTIDTFGNITTAGTIQAAGGLFSVDNLGNLIANSLTASQLTVNGDAQISGNLTVNGGLKTNNLTALADSDLTISLGGISTSTVIRFTDSLHNELFTLNQTGDATFAGTIYADAFVTNSTADLAEHFPTTDNSIAAGDIVAVDVNNEENVVKSDRDYQETILGVISTAPGVTLNSTEVNGKPLALAGRVPVKVNLENGEIKAGDPITSSSTAGVGMKATQAGRIIGIAMESFGSSGSFVTSGTSTIVVFVNPVWYLGASLAANGSIALNDEGLTTNASVNCQLSTVNCQTNPDGTLASEALAKDETMNDEQIKALVASEVQKQVGEILGSSLSSEALAKEDNPKIDSPVPSDLSDLSDSSDTSESSASSSIASATEDAIAESAQLAAETQSTLDKLTELLSTVNLEPSTLTVTGATNLANVQTAGTFSQDGTFIIDYGKQLNVLGNTLYLQNDPFAGSPSCHPELVSGSDKSCGTLLDIGNGKFIFDRRGTLTAKEIIADNVQTKQITINTSDPNAQTVGSSTISAGKLTTTIFTTALKPNARVLITPSGPTGGKSLYVQSKSDFEGFTVALDGQPSTKPIIFDWLIVNTNQVSSR